MFTFILRSSTQRMELSTAPSLFGAVPFSFALQFPPIVTLWAVLQAEDLSLLEELIPG
jgi:hypothetical protein